MGRACAPAKVVEARYIVYCNANKGKRARPAAEDGGEASRGASLCTRCALLLQGVVAVRAEEVVDLLDHGALQDVEGVVDCGGRPCRGLRDGGAVNAAPVQSRLYSLALLERHHRVD